MLGEIGKIINFCWTPSHIGIHGNNEADKAAKSAFDFVIVKFKIPSLERSTRMRKVVCSNPSRDRPKSLKQVVTSPTPNARHYV